LEIGSIIFCGHPRTWGGVHENPSQKKKLGFEVCTNLPATAGSTNKRITAQTSPGKSRTPSLKKQSKMLEV
jgi:hypothetical protein